MMTKAKKPSPKAAAAPKKLTAMEKMVQECVKNARARKKSGETDQTWRKEYASTLKVDTPVALSETPFAGDTIKKKS